MNDDHVFVDEDGTKWNRVWYPLELNTSGEVDPWSRDDFVNKTGNDKGTIGDLLDRSTEMSQKRADQCGGVDPVKEKYYKDYAKKRGGTPHPHKTKRKSVDNKNFRIDFD